MIIAGVGGFAALRHDPPAVLAPSTMDADCAGAAAEAAGCEADWGSALLRAIYERLCDFAARWLGEIGGRGMLKTSLCPRSVFRPHNILMTRWSSADA